jgi:acyl carrier protein
MNDAIEDRVYALVADELGVKREKVSPNSKLSHDLGMEGDDAVEFFEKFSKEFSVDLKQLGEDWHAYFSPEGAGLRTILCILVPSGVLTAALHFAFSNLSIWLCGIVGFGCWIAAIAYWQKTHPDRYPQISVQELIDCASTGVWTKDLPVDVRARLLKYRSYGWLGRWFTS